ncbi:hypothetical protein ACTXT7_006218 [Hymenolepis weldensis]
MKNILEPLNEKFSFAFDNRSACKDGFQTSELTSGATHSVCTEPVTSDFTDEIANHYATNMLKGDSFGFPVCVTYPALCSLPSCSHLALSPSLLSGQL